MNAVASVYFPRWSWELSNSWVLLHPFGRPEVLLGTHLHMHGKSREVTSREALQVAHSSLVIKVRSSRDKLEGVGIHVVGNIDVKWCGHITEIWPEWVLWEMISSICVCVAGVRPRDLHCNHGGSPSIDTFLLHGILTSEFDWHHNLCPILWSMYSIHVAGPPPIQHSSTFRCWTPIIGHCSLEAMGLPHLFC